jgi:hypothetical protein
VRIERLLDESLIIAPPERAPRPQQGRHRESQLSHRCRLAQTSVPPAERRRIAIHEAGHALVAAVSGRDVRIASILRRGASLGLVAHSDAEERHLKTPTELGDLIAVAMAGRAAEIQEFGEASSGIASDLAAATTLAAQMVGALGVADSLLSLEAAHMPIAGNLVAKVMNDEPSRRKAEAIVNTAADRRPAWCSSTVTTSSRWPTPSATRTSSPATRSATSSTAP